MSYENSVDVVVVGFAAVVSALVGYAIGVDQRPVPPSINDALPLAIVHKGESLADNHFGFGEIHGDVRAGEDLLIVLWNGAVWGEQLVRVPIPCHEPDPIDPSLGNIERDCGAMIELIGDDAYVGNINLTGDPSSYAVRRISAKAELGRARRPLDVLAVRDPPVRCQEDGLPRGQVHRVLPADGPPDVGFEAVL